MIGVFSTAYVLIPRFQEGTIRTAFANVSKINGNLYEIDSIHWPICNGNVDNTTENTCLNSWPVQHTEEFLANLTSYFSCNFNFTETLQFSWSSNVSQTEMGSFCSLTNVASNISGSFLRCDILEHPNVSDKCDSTLGNRTLTFWLTFANQLIISVSLLHV